MSIVYSLFDTYAFVPFCNSIFIIFLLFSSRLVSFDNFRLTVFYVYMLIAVTTKFWFFSTLIKMPVTSTATSNLIFWKMRVRYCILHVLINGAWKSHLYNFFIPSNNLKDGEKRTSSVIFILRYTRDAKTNKNK